MYDGKLTLIPEEKKKIHRVLDVGTGTGIWALDYGDEHPDATGLFRLLLTWVFSPRNRYSWAFYEPYFFRLICL